MTIQSFVRDDLKFIPKLQPEGWPDITPSIDFYTKSSFCYPIKVSVDHKIAGIGTAIIHHDVAWLAHIVVHADSRRKGIGRLITEALVNQVEVKKCETIYLLATDLGAPVYEKVGFETESEYIFFKEVSVKDDSETSPKIHSYKPEFKNEISEIDKMNSGEDRMFHLETHLQNGCVYLNDQIHGFYLPGFGDGLIIANNSTAGMELLKLHLRSNEKVVFPKDNLVATNFLYKLGFKECLTAKRMRLGKKRSVKLENIYNRIGGNLG